MRARAAVGSRRPDDAHTPAGTIDLGQRPVERMWSAYCAAFTANDWGRRARWFTDDLRLVDHRTLGLEEIRGAEAFLDAQRSRAAVAPAARMEVRALLEAGDDVAAVVCALHAETHRAGVGGEMDIPLGAVTRLRDGRFDLIELFAHDDEDAMRAGAGAAGRAPARARAGYSEVVAGAAAMFTPGFTLVDHREIGWEDAAGPAAAVELHRGAAELAADLTVDVEAVIARHPVVGVEAVRSRVTGDGGRAQNVYGVLALIDDRRFEHVEFFEPDDAGLLARYEELRALRRRRPVSPVSAARNRGWATAASAATSTRSS